MEKLSGYFCPNHLPFGKPLCIISVWDTQDEIFCEYTIYFILHNKQRIKSIYKHELTSVLKSDWRVVCTLGTNEEIADEVLLDEFRLEHGIQQAEAHLFKILLDLSEKNGGSNDFSPNKLELLEKSVINILVQLKNNSPEDFIKLSQQTKSKELKKIIRITDEMNIHPITEE